MPRSTEEEVAEQQQQAAAQDADPKRQPTAQSLQQQGSAAVSRQLATTIGGMHVPPVGTKLYVQSGAVTGKKLFLPYHIEYGGTAEIVAADANHLVLQVEATGHYIKDFDRTSDLNFNQADANHLSMSGDIKDNKNPNAKPDKIDNVTLTLEAGSGGNQLKFKDSKKGNEGSIVWDGANQLLKLTYSDGNFVILGPNPPAKK